MHAACPLLQHMGIARVQCTSGCCCDETQLDSTTLIKVTDQQMHVIKVRLPGAGCPVAVSLLTWATNSLALAITFPITRKGCLSLQTYCLICLHSLPAGVATPTVSNPRDDCRGCRSSAL